MLEKKSSPDLRCQAFFLANARCTRSSGPVSFREGCVALTGGAVGERTTAGRPAGWTGLCVGSDLPGIGGVGGAGLLEGRPVVPREPPPGLRGE